MSAGASEAEVSMKTNLLDIRNCDCMDMMRAAPDNHWDLAIVDPPYGRNEGGGNDRCGFVRQKNGKKIPVVDGKYVKKDWDNAPAGPEYFHELFRVSKNQIIWGINYYDIKAPGGRIVWDKVNDGAHQSGAEIAYCSMNERVDLVRYLWRGMMQGVSIKQGTVQQGDKSLNEKRIHPTQKPIILYRWLLNKYAQPGQRILDTFMGSGSIAIACHYAGYHLTACELDPDYFQDAVKRIREETAQMELGI